MEQNYFTARLSEKQFGLISDFIYNECGIKLPSQKKIMVEARLRKRLKELDIHTFDKYFEYLNHNKWQDDEIIEMIDVITTNKTDFFREPGQYEYLINKVIPEFLDKNTKIIPPCFNIWSAGCSTGEEPYTMAMLFNEFKISNHNFSFKIFASDISITALKKAIKAIYTMDIIKPIDYRLQKKYLLISKDKAQGIVRIVPELRKQINFLRINFLDENYGFHFKFNAIFCRNVIIYFDKKTQVQIISKLIDNLEIGGYLFLGHSETAYNVDLPIEQVAPCTYLKTEY
jgi:chemotaxis protein methyltransferase CheR